VSRIELVVTEETTIRELREAVLKHFKDNPTHGNGCACLDSLTGPGRAAFHKDKPIYPDSLTDSERKAWWGVDYLLSMMRER
jgi:hypothetical protein